MEKMKIYEAVKACPEEALREIKAGRLKGKSDINPMWRIKTLTEQFGPCGVGWKYEIVEKRLEKGGGAEIAAFVDINLYIKAGEGWSEAIPGTGGSMFVATESKGPYTSDECFKMALTDAISVACKALGMAADVYWEKDATKYTRTQGAAAAHRHSSDNDQINEVYLDAIKALVEQKGWTMEGCQEYCRGKWKADLERLTMGEGAELISMLNKKPDKARGTQV